jgi:hypothetical protein
MELALWNADHAKVGDTTSTREETFNIFPPGEHFYQWILNIQSTITTAKG